MDPCQVPQPASAKAACRAPAGRVNGSNVRSDGTVRGSGWSNSFADAAVPDQRCLAVHSVAAGPEANWAPRHIRDRASGPRPEIADLGICEADPPGRGRRDASHA